MSEVVGYKLVDKSGNVINQWGGVWGQCPAIPDMISCPNGDQVHCPQINTDYSGVRIVEWTMDQPVIQPPTLAELQAQITALTNEINALTSATAGTNTTA